MECRVRDRIFKLRRERGVGSSRRTEVVAKCANGKKEMCQDVLGR